jgi:GxxExxY protein
MSLIYKEMSYKIVGCAMEVHNELGYGFLEKVYENDLMFELKNKNIEAKNQIPIKVNYKGNIVGDYIADILIEDKVIIELKSVENIIDSHISQTINYLKATGLKLAIIINFGKQKLEYERIVL